MSLRGRRRILAGIGALALAGLNAPRAHAMSAQARAAWQAITGGRTPRAGRVALEIPTLAENGNSVPLRVAVEGPGRVLRLHLLSEENPRPVIASVSFGARAGRRVLVTRIRLAATQRVHAIAEFDDGSLWLDSKDVSVTVAACYDGS